MKLSDDDYYIAAVCDAVAENLTLGAVDAAHSVASNAEQFFWAVQAAVRLKEIADGALALPSHEAP